MKKALTTFLFLFYFFSIQSQIATMFNDGFFEYIIKDPYSTNSYEVSLKKYNDCPKGTLTIPETISYNSKIYKITGIAKDAFVNCINLTHVVFNNNIKYIGDSAFKNTGLLDLIYPKRLNKVGNKIFSSCKNLINVIVEEGVTYLGNDTFTWCKNLTDVTLPNSLITIGYGTFSACKSLKEIKLPNSISSIGSGTFGGCDSLVDVTIPTSLINLTYNTFSGCNSLKNIIIPNNIKNIESSNFSDCKSLESITIPFNVESIGDYAFYNCKSLKKVIVNNDKPILINKTVFKDVAISNIPLTVPYGRKKIYKTTSIWEDFGIINESEIINNEIDMQLYPNPVDDELNILFKSNSTLKLVNIYNILGQLVKIETSTKINIESLQSGIYSIEVLTNKGKATKKLIIE